MKGVASSLRNEGMESIGMALDYLVGWPRYVHPGKPVGLRPWPKEILRSTQGMGVLLALPSEIRRCFAECWSVAGF